MYLYMGKDYTEPDVLYRHPDTVREEVYTLKKTLEEGEEKLARLEAQRKTLLALSSLTGEEALCEMAERIAAAEREYEDTLAALASREDELSEILFVLRRGLRR